MTVSYQSDVASSTSGGLIRLLWRWRGSVWKLVYMELMLFLTVYIALAFSYDFLLTENQRRMYEKVVLVCSAFVDMIPLSFILGFYVSFTATRWWNQYTAIPWPDKIMNNIAMYIPGTDEQSRILRRTLMRYLNLTLVLVLRSISIAVKRRFPTKEHLVEAGFMTKPELEMYSAVPATEFNTFWIPCTWFVNLLRDARQECRITDSSGLKLIMEEFNDYRNKCGLLWSYDWVSIPLVYTQVVTISTYAFFVASLFGRQHVNPPKYPNLFLTPIEHRGEYYIPVFTILQFLLYMGLLKLGEQLINPFGDDDEDFELNWIIDRHIKVSFLGVDVLNINPPPIMKDNYFDESDIKLPYTAAAVSYKKKTYRGSMAAYHVPSEQQGLVVPDFEEDEYHEVGDQSNMLTVTDKRSRESVWSAFGPSKLQKKHSESASLVSLESETGNQSDAWQSSISLLSPDDNTQNVMTTIPEESAAQGTKGGRDRLDSVLLAKTKRSPSLLPGTPPRGYGSGHGSFSDTPPLLMPFDPTLGIFSAKLGVDATSSRKASSASIAKDLRGVSPSPVSRSPSSSSKKSLGKVPKSAILKFRKADPKLTIRPFRSRVTFSEDTKEATTQLPRNMYHVEIAKPSRGMRMDGVDLTISSPELSEADLLTAYIEHRDTLSNRNSASPTSKNASFLSQIPSHPSHKPLTPVLEETRHQSIGDDANNSPVFPIDLITAIGLPHEYWLRHQSLPNIQEIGDQESSSSPSSSNRSPGFRYSLRRRNSDKSSQDRKLSIKRQKAEDKSSPPKDGTCSTPDELKRRDSAEEKRKKYSGMGESSGSTSVGSTSSAAKKHKKKIQAQHSLPTTEGSTAGMTGAATASPSKGALKQSSTDSGDSGSYVTARSCVIQISTEDANDEDDGGGGSTPATNRNMISLAEFKKSSQSTSSSAASYASARDLFGRASLDNSIVDNIPMIVVVQTSPAASEVNISSPSRHGRETASEARAGAESSTSSRDDSSSTPTIGKRNGSPTSSTSTTSNICDLVGDKKR